MFQRYFSGIKTEEFLEKCLQLGGRKTEGKADVTAVIQEIQAALSAGEKRKIQK